MNQMMKDEESNGGGQMDGDAAGRGRASTLHPSALTDDRKSLFSMK